MGHFRKTHQTTNKVSYKFRGLQEPLTSTVDGSTKYITMITICSVFDNLVDRVDFTYKLSYDDFSTAINGEYSLDETCYSTWDASEIGAYKIVCDALNIKIKEE